MLFDERKESGNDGPGDEERNDQTDQEREQILLCKDRKGLQHFVRGRDDHGRERQEE